MSKEDRYFTVPLAILRSCESALDVLNACVGYGIVNAGIGFKQVHGEEKFAALLEEAQGSAEESGLSVTPLKKLKFNDADGSRVSDEKAEELWLAALVGWKLLGVSGGSCKWNVETWLNHHHSGGVFFRIKSDWLWGAVYTARRDTGQFGNDGFKPLSWRECRVLAAILSTQVNKLGFTFCGWETIQARACGFHTKKLFQERREALPDHCRPLSRQMIRDTCETLEGNGFYARCRYAAGERGGMSAYSFRHPQREDLLAAVCHWSATNRFAKEKVATHREADKQAFKRTKKSPTDNQHK